MTTIASAIIVGKIASTYMLSDACKQMYETMKSLCVHYSSFPYLQQTMEQLDIDATVRVIEELMLEMEHKKLTKTEQIALNNLHKTVDTIHDRLKKIHEDLEYHKTKWFYYWRTPYCYYEVDFLKKDKLIMDQRFDILLKVRSS